MESAMARGAFGGVISVHGAASARFS